MTGSYRTGWPGVCFAIAMLVACGHHNNGNGDSDANSSSMGDGGIDAPPFSGKCDPNGPQCANCKDDDGDGLIDGFDPECTGPNDNDEKTFATGDPGDNKDPVMQDCFFDGNSGAGNDGCNIHVCCLLGAKTVAQCPVGANRYNPDDCPPPLGKTPISQQCIDTCGKLTPPGCDCFGCCTICVPNTTPSQCYDVVINPVVSGCAPDVLSDPTKCLRCTKSTQCGPSPCGGMTCILCPGQDPGDLPPGCTGATCPTGQQACSNGECPTGTYCSNGCCVGVIL